MKRTLAVVLGLTGAMTGLSPAWAEDSDGVPYEACRNVKLVKNEAEKKQYEQTYKGCKAAITYSVPTIKNPDARTVAQIQVMLSHVAEDVYVKDLKKRLKYWKGVKACFENPKSSSKCAKDIQKISSTYGDFVGQLRKDLAQTQLSSQKGQLKVTETLGSISTDVKYIPRAVPEAITGKLDAKEIGAVESGLKSAKAGDLNKLENQAKESYVEHLNTGVLKNGLYLVSYLPKPSGYAKDGSPTWTTGKDGEWSKTIQRLIDDAEHEEKITLEAVDACRNGTSKKSSAGCTVAFPAFGMKDIVPNWNADKRDLMYYGTMTHEMNKWLRMHPEDCGAAVGATEWMHGNENLKMAATITTAVGTGGGAGILSKFGRIGKTLGFITAAGGGTVGTLMTYTDYDNTQKKADTAARQIAKIGVDAAAEPDVIDPKAYAEAKETADQWLTNVAKSQGIFLGGMAGGYGVVKAAPVLAKAMMSASKPVQKSLASLFLRTSNVEKTAAELDKLAVEHPALKTNLSSAEVAEAKVMAPKLAPRLASLEKEMPAEDVRQIENLLMDAKPRVMEKLEAEGRCSGSLCAAPAAEKEAEALDDAVAACKKS